jgi:hypothetical protein
MLFNPAIDSLEEVLAIRAKAKEMLADGAQVLEWTNEAQSVRKVIGLPLETVLTETEAYLLAYSRGAVITRTKPLFV